MSTSSSTSTIVNSFNSNNENCIDENKSTTTTRSSSSCCCGTGDDTKCNPYDVETQFQPQPPTAAAATTTSLLSSSTTVGDVVRSMERTTTPTTTTSFVAKDKQLEEQRLRSVQRQGSVNVSALQWTNRLYKCFDDAQILPKILVLFCGGTLVMCENIKDGGSLIVNEIEPALQQLLQLEPRLTQEVAQLYIHVIENIDSSNMSPALWDEIGSVIAQQYDRYDGFVITHGTDTMSYTASALSFVLQDIGKPVVLTGAQIPGSRIETDARRNFVNAVRVATLCKCGIMIVFDGDILLGARSHKLSESKLDAFGTINWRNLGEIRIDIRFSEDAIQRHSRPLQHHPGFESHIAVFTLFPGFPAQDLIHAITYGVKGIILRGYGSGNISSIYLDAVKLAKEKQIPVVVNSQCLEGATLMHLYDVGKQALKHGVIQAYDMSNECVITKLMWCLKHASSYENIRELMHTNYTGEISKDGKLYR